jgi:predicted phage terminase large subunit-like protein
VRRRGSRLYLIDILRARLDYPGLKRAVRAEYARLTPDVVLIEDRASGTQLIQELAAEPIHAVTRYQPQGDKVMRLHAQTATIENGFVHLPQTAPWLAEYLHELAVFPNGRHDPRSMRRRSFSTGSSAPARTASTPITGCAPRNWAKQKRPHRPDPVLQSKAAIGPRGREVGTGGR